MKFFKTTLILFCLGTIIYFLLQQPTVKTYISTKTPGQVLDQFNGVTVYYNGSTGKTHGRNTINGYNLGLKYQCVEFVKRYYYEVYKHKMPNSYGNALDFFDKNISDGKLNRDRALLQFTNPSNYKPEIGDLLVFDKTIFNTYGHVAIVSKVSASEIEIIQQNVGAKTRDDLKLSYKTKYKLESERVLGWLRKP